MSESSSKELSVVIPAFREAGRIENSIPLIDEWLDSFPLSTEVKIIVEKSPDKTVEVAREAAAKAKHSSAIEVIDNQVQRGKGYAVRTGMLRSCGAVRMFMDADLSVPLHEISKAVSRFHSANAPDIVVGTRYEGGNIVKKQGLVRRLGSRCYNLLLKGLGLTWAEDTQCGFKFFTDEACEVFRMAEIDGFGFDIELLLLAKKLGYRVEQMPVEWHNVGDSRFNSLRDGPRVLLDAVRVRLRLGGKLRK